MSLFEDKKNIFNQIGSLNSLKNDNINPVNKFNSYSSISNSRDSSSFLIDLLVSLGGSDNINNIFSNLFTTYITEFEGKINNIYINQLIDYDSVNNLPNEFVNNGYDINIRDIDTFNDFFITETDPYADLVYESDPNSFNNKIKEIINTPFTNIVYSDLVMNYNNITEVINIKPNSASTVRDFLYTYIYSFNKINQKKLITDIFNIVFGTLYNYKSNTKKQIKDIEEINLIIEKLINDDSFSLTENELINLNNSVEYLYNGNELIDLGCGYINNSITMSEINEFASDINNNNITQFEDKLNSLVDNVYGENNSEQNNNIKLNFFKRLINAFKIILIRNLFLSPEKKLLFLIYNKIKNIEFNNNTDFIENNINNIKCIKNNIDSDINEYIFNYIKKILIDLTKPLALKIINENIKNYINIIKSLII